MVTVAIMVVLVKVAAPSFTNLIQTGNISSSVNTFIADLRYGRSEAVRRGGSVVMCRSASPEAASPTCGTGMVSWTSGWIIFVDRDNSGDFNTGDQMLRVQSALSSPDSIDEASGGSTKFDFTALGRRRTVGTTTQVTFGSTIPTARKRVLCVDTAGRARIAGDGTTSCGTDS